MIGRNWVTWCACRYVVRVRHVSCWTLTMIDVVETVSGRVAVTDQNIVQSLFQTWPQTWCRRRCIVCRRVWSWVHASQQLHSLRCVSLSLSLSLSLCKTRMMGLPGRTRSLTISSAVSIQCTNVTDGQTDGHPATAKTALWHSVARSKLNSPFG